MFFKSRRETTIFDQFCFRGELKPSTRVGIQGLKVLTGLHDSCSSRIDWTFKTNLFANCKKSLHSVGLTRVSFRDFPLRYEMRGGSLKMFLRYGWFCIRCHFPMSMFLRLGNVISVLVLSFCLRK